MEIHPFVAPLSNAARVDFALAYPFEQAVGSYVFAEGEAWLLEGWHGTDFAGAVIREGGTLRETLGPRLTADLDLPRMPVIAVGSNASPAQLARKYAARDDVIPTIRAWLPDHAVVYAAHITEYGSIPATLTQCPGERVQVFVNFLTDSQRERMDATETLGRHYAFSVQRGLDLTLENGAPLGEAAVYGSLTGLVGLEGEPVRLAAISHGPGLFPERDQKGVMNHVRELLEPDMSLEAFVLSQIADSGVRRDREERLQAFTLPTRLA